MHLLTNFFFHLKSFKPSFAEHSRTNKEVAGKDWTWREAREPQVTRSRVRTSWLLISEAVNVLLSPRYYIVILVRGFSNCAFDWIPQILTPWFYRLLSFYCTSFRSSPGRSRRCCCCSRSRRWRSWSRRRCPSRPEPEKTFGRPRLWTRCPSEDSGEKFVHQMRSLLKI